MSYKPFIYKLSHANVSELFSSKEFSKEFSKETTSVVSSSHIYMPLFSLGYHSFIHRTKSLMSITNKLETKNEFHLLKSRKTKKQNDY